MEVRMTNRHAKLLVEATKDSVKEIQADGEGVSYNVEFSIAAQPGFLSDSATLSILDALHSALAKFSNEEPIRLALNVVVASPTQDLLLNKVQQKFESVVKLETPASTLVGANGAPLASE
jgi:hypothetical protein